MQLAPPRADLGAHCSAIWYVLNASVPPIRSQTPWKQRLPSYPCIAPVSLDPLTSLISSPTTFPSLHSTPLQTHQPPCCSPSCQGNTSLRAFTSAIPCVLITQDTLLLVVCIACSFMSFSFCSDVPFLVRPSLTTFSKTASPRAQHFLSAYQAFSP